MSQMKPINWLFLFIHFTMMFLFMNNNLYFLIMKNLCLMKLMMMI